VANAPSEAQRQALLKLVLELNVQVMELARAQREEAPPSSRSALPGVARPSQRSAASKSARPSRTPKR